MVKLLFPLDIEDKLFEVKSESNEIVSKIVSYFPLSKSEKQTICLILKNDSFTRFYSIFSDSITDEEWNSAKGQIKKKFKDELFDIDN